MKNPLFGDYNHGTVKKITIEHIEKLLSGEKNVTNSYCEISNAMKEVVAYEIKNAVRELGAITGNDSIYNHNIVMDTYNSKGDGKEIVNRCYDLYTAIALRNSDQTFVERLKDTIALIKSLTTCMILDYILNENTKNCEGPCFCFGEYHVDIFR